jgi:hypothetical protein
VERTASRPQPPRKVRHRGDHSLAAAVGPTSVRLLVAMEASTDQLPQRPQFDFSQKMVTGDSVQRCRDLFPLPAISTQANTPAPSLESTGAKRRRVRRLQNCHAANNVIAVLNDMYAPTSVSKSASAHASLLKMTESQREAQRQIMKQVIQPPHSKHVYSKREAVDDLCDHPWTILTRVPR